MFSASRGGRGGDTEMKGKSKAAGAKRGTPDAAAAALRDTARYLMNTYQRPPVVFTRGQGCYLYDSRGKKYLDFVGGLAVNALGHAHPRLVRVVRREAARMIHLSNLYHHPYQGPLARKLATWSGMDRVFFCNSGTEAIEGALKLARLAARKRGATGQDAHPGAGELISRTDHGSGFHHAYGEVPRAVRAADSGRGVRARERRRGPGGQI